MKIMEKLRKSVVNSKNEIDLFFEIYFLFNFNTKFSEI